MARRKDEIIYFEFNTMKEGQVGEKVRKMRPKQQAREGHSGWDEIQRHYLC